MGFGSIRHAYSYADSNCNADGKQYANSNVHTNCNSNRYGYSYCDIHADSDAYLKLQRPRLVSASTCSIR